MLSILIPIYNHKVVKLVDELIRQCTKCKVAHEIICLDDKSDQQFRDHNGQINAWLGVNYVELSENLGRAKIRNRLAQLARYDWLLLLDADTKLRSKKFIKNYIASIDEDIDAIVEGILYPMKPPRIKNKMLHWKAGSKKEMRSLSHRNKKPHHYFHTANVLIKREVLLNHPFDQKMKGYGYEDIALGCELRKSNLRILHIDNPILHSGLKKAKDYVEDQITASQNLASLFYENKVTDTRLIRTLNWIRNFGLQDLVFDYLHTKIKNYEDSLVSGEISLRKLDLIKLYYVDRALTDLYNRDK